MYKRQVQIRQILDYLSPSYVAGLTLLGGEPFEPSNQAGLLPLLRLVKETCPQKNIWCFTGYDFEKDILGRMYRECPETPEFLSHLDILVDGPFIEELKSPSLIFKGSSNQRTIRVPESLARGEIVLHSFPDYQ